MDIVKKVRIKKVYKQDIKNLMLVSKSTEQTTN